MLVRVLIYLAIAAVWILALGGAMLVDNAKRPRPQDGDGADGKQADDGLPLAA